MTRKSHNRKLAGNPLTVRGGGALAGSLVNAISSGVTKAVKNKVYEMVDNSANSATNWMMGGDNLKTLNQMLKDGSAPASLRKYSGSVGSNSVRGRSRNIPLSIPTGFGEAVQGTPMTFGSAARHPIHGPGLRFIGSEFTVSCAVAPPPTISPTEQGIFSQAPGSGSASGIKLNPRAATDDGYYFPRLATISEIFDLFVFRSFSIRYVPNVGTSQSGAIAIGYCRDGGEDTGQIPNCAAVLQLAPSTMSPTYVGFTYNVPCGTRGDEIYYTRRVQPATMADDRMTSQGVLVGRSNIAPPADERALLGTFIVSYVIDLYSPCSHLDILPALKPPSFSSSSDKKSTDEDRREREDSDYLCVRRPEERRPPLR